MKAQLVNQKSVGTKYAARYIASFRVNLPIEKIDLYKWITEMNDEDYSSYSPAHKAMGSLFKDAVFHTVNVENIGNETLVQHYELKYHTPHHVQLYSPETKAYVMRWFPAKVGVPWEMQVQATSARSVELVCMIGTDFSSWLLKLAAWMNGLGGFFIKRHLRKEGKAFARDLERKFRAE